MFITLLGDMDVRDVTNAALRTFGYRTSYLSAQTARAASWNADNLEKILRENGEGSLAAGPSALPIGEKTLVNKTIGVIRTVVRFYCEEQGLHCRLDNFRFTVPEHTLRSKGRSKATPDRINLMFKAGFDDGCLVHSTLPLLDALTRRRISLLAILRTENM